MKPKTLRVGEGQEIALQAGHRMKFLNRNTNSTYSIMELTAPPDTPGPPLHLHRIREEAFYVLEGTFGFQLGEQTFTGSPGAFVIVPKEVAHTYWIQGVISGKMLILISPSGYENYFEELSAGLAIAGDSIEAGMRVRQSLAAKYDMVVISPPSQSHGR